MTPEEIENCWKDPENHRWGVYYCPDDPRIIVPRRVRWTGWTINFARRSAFPMLVLMLLLIVVPQTAVKTIGGGPVDGVITAGASIAVLCLLCSHLSSSARWNH